MGAPLAPCCRCGARFGVGDVIRATSSEPRPHHTDCNDPQGVAARLLDEDEFPNTLA